MANNEASLLGVPPELRLKIYDYLLPTAVGVRKAAEPKHSVSFLRTCRQVYREASDRLYASCTFGVSISVLDKIMKMTGHEVDVMRVGNTRGRHFEFLGKATRINLRFDVHTDELYQCETQDMIARFVSELDGAHQLQHLDIDVGILPPWGGWGVQSKEMDDLTRFVLRPLCRLRLDVAKPCNFRSTVRLLIRNHRAAVEHYEHDLQTFLQGAPKRFSRTDGPNEYSRMTDRLTALLKSRDKNFKRSAFKREFAVARVKYDMLGLNALHGVLATKTREQGFYEQSAELDTLFSDFLWSAVAEKDVEVESGSKDESKD